MKEFYSSNELSMLWKVSRNTVTALARKNGIKPKPYKFGKRFEFTKEEVLDLKEFREKPKFKPFDPEIIYVTRTTEILHSKLNFLTLEQL